MKKYIWSLPVLLLSAVLCSCLLANETAEAHEAKSWENAPAGAISSEMIAGWNARGSYKPFYEAALKNPRAGGVFYALRIVAGCSHVMKEAGSGWQGFPPLRNPDPDHRAMSEAAAELEAKCSEFTPEELSPAHAEAIRNSETGKLDPLLTVMKALEDKTCLRDAECRKKMVREMIKLRDPLLIMSKIGFAGYIDPETRQMVFIEFAGKRYVEGSGMNAAFALEMLPCGLGLRCDKHEFETALKCASQGWCFESRIEALQQAISGGVSEADLRGTMELYRQMVEAVKNGDETKFMN